MNIHSSQLPSRMPSDRKADGPDTTGLSTSERALLPCDEALEQITKFLKTFNPKGVQGFSITAKSDHSTMNLKWGSLKIKGRNP